MSALFSPLTLKSLTVANRIFVSPMCQYSCADGLPTDWHLVHLGSRAVGGAALVMTEAAAVLPAGRISPEDAGIWNDSQRDAWAPIARFIKAQGSVPAMQLAHAGRKASTFAPWRGHGAVAENAGGWPVAGPSAVALSDHYPAPQAMDDRAMAACVEAFAQAARRAHQAGFEVIEIHAAHGYLLHAFLSPLSNLRTDAYGGSLDNRMRFPMDVIRAVRAAWPEALPLFLRISATDWKDGGWDVAQSIAFVRAARAAGVDLVDVSSGGNAADQKIALRPGYQVPFARALRDAVGLPTGAVGLITEPVQAEQIVAEGSADAVFLARAMLRDPYWPRHAAHALGVPMAWPDPYRRCDVGPLGR
ncbi:MAG: NADH:flavin oxidoreductase/NADH oxidase [Betaproteobacteria bacterium]|nr:NADH:flavin oxidoreductase/NADH oxidase [Betaproteobacteria bacterium]